MGCQGLQGTKISRAAYHGQVARPVTEAIKAIKVIAVIKVIKVIKEVRDYWWSTSANSLNLPADSASVLLLTLIVTRLTSTVEVPQS